MGQPAAKQGDQVTGIDVHIVLVPALPGPPVPTPLPHPFTGLLTGNLSTDVTIMGAAAAVLGSTATNSPAHIPNGPGSFQRPPSNSATVIGGSTTVTINGKPAARTGDRALTCNDPSDLPAGTVLATGTVLIG